MTPRPRRGWYRFRHGQRSSARRPAGPFPPPTSRFRPERGGPAGARVQPAGSGNLWSVVPSPVRWAGGGVPAVPTVANEGGLRALGSQIDRASAGRRRRRPAAGRPEAGGSARSGRAAAPGGPVPSPPRPPQREAPLEPSAQDRDRPEQRRRVRAGGCRRPVRLRQVPVRPDQEGPCRRRGRGGVGSTLQHAGRGLGLEGRAQRGCARRRPVRPPWSAVSGVT